MNSIVNTWGMKIPLPVDIVGRPLTLHEDLPTQQPDVPFEGVFVMLGADARILPALSAAAARLHWDRIRAMEQGSEPDPIGLTVSLVTACLQRNYPEVTQEWVADRVDMENWELLSVAVFGRGAYRRWVDAQKALQAQRGDPEGNLPAPQPMPVAGGAPSTPASPPQPAGATATSTS
jgi:hypothetical protein